MKCQSFAFQCAYGACVDADARCNNEKDCIDNSDEFLCSQKTNIHKMLRGNCTENKFQCKSLQCIDLDYICDGEINCADRSDEIVDVCAIFKCETFTFRCGYGACIDENVKCNGFDDCADGSDENYKLCNYNKTQIAEKPIGNSCIIRDIPINGWVKYAGTAQQLQIGSIISEFESITYGCKHKYNLVHMNSNNTNLCIDGSIENIVPKCIKYCAATTLTGITTKIDCEYDRKLISCNQFLQPGTIAKISCNYGYELPEGSNRDRIRCDNDGEWDYNPFKCNQICGIASTDAGLSYIVGGENTNNTKVPWHVGIYSDLIQRNKFIQICGGTIITAKIVLSAAHCFWDQAKEQFYDKKHFSVAAGKYYRDYDAIEPLKAQFFSIDYIYGVRGYADVTTQYLNDITILILKNYIQFRSYIAPICLDYTSQKNQKYVRSHLNGRVAGWGLESSGGESSPVLKVFDLPTVSYDDCKDQSTPEFKPFITFDKFCAGYINAGISVCQGDSGGGLVIQKDIGNIKAQKLYYLYGIVSSGARKIGSCDTNKYTTFTNVLHHIDFIKDVELDYRHVNKFNLRNHW